MLNADLNVILENSNEMSSPQAFKSHSRNHVSHSRQASDQLRKTQDSEDEFFDLKRDNSGAKAVLTNSKKGTKSNLLNHRDVQSYLYEKPKIPKCPIYERSMVSNSRRSHVEELSSEFELDKTAEFSRTLVISNIMPTV